MTISTLSMSELQTLHTQITNSRDQAIIKLVLETGCYVDEIIHLTVKDINHDSKTLHFNGKRMRTVTLTHDTYSAIKTWILHRPSTSLQELFITHKHPFRPLSSRGIDAMLRKWGETTRLPVLNFQLLRRTSKTTRINEDNYSDNKDSGAPLLLLSGFVFLFRVFQLLQKRDK